MNLIVCVFQDEGEDDSDLSDYGDETDGRKDALAEPCFMLIGEIFELRGSEYKNTLLRWLAVTRSDAMCAVRLTMWNATDLWPQDSRRVSITLQIAQTETANWKYSQKRPYIAKTLLRSHEVTWCM